MVEIAVQKQLIVEEDIAYGTGTVAQVRGGVNLNLRKVRTIVPVSSLEDLNALDTSKFTRAVLFDGKNTTFYNYYSGAWNNAALINVIDNIAALATYIPIAGHIYLLKDSGRTILARAGGITPNNETTYASGTAGVYFEFFETAFQSTDASTYTHTMRVDRSTSENADAILSNHTCSGAAQGYAGHFLDGGESSLGDPYIVSKGNSAAGGALGAATSRTTPADAIVANRRGSGDGSAVVGSRWEDGNGNGLMGVKRGAGVGHAVFGYKVLVSEGHAVHGLNESTEGDGVFGHRNNGGGPGAGVSGYAQGTGGGGSLNASVYGFKLSGDNGHSGYFESINASGDFAVLSAVAFGGTYSAFEVSSNSTNTSAITAQVTRGNGLTGVAQKVRVSGFGARTGLLVAAQSFIQPAGASTGTAAVIAHDIQITASVTGSASATSLSVNNAATSGVNSYGVTSVVTGTNTTNYAVYGNATGGTTNWSGYFVGNVFHGGSLVPSDSRLKDIHGVVDGEKMLANVMACPVYCYDKYAAWDDKITDNKSENKDYLLDREGNIINIESRAKILTNEIGPIAQELQQVTPDHVIATEKYLAVNDRSELYQLKAAVQYLTSKVLGV